MVLVFAHISFVVNRVIQHNASGAVATVIVISSHTVNNIQITQNNKTYKSE